MAEEPQRYIAISAESFRKLKTITDITYRSRPKQLEFMIAEEVKKIDESENDPKDA